MGAEGRAGSVALVAALFMVSTLGGFLVYVHETEGTTTDGYGYTITDPVLDERMSRHPGCLEISPEHTTARYDFGSEGMAINLASPGDKVQVAKDQAADTFTTVLDIHELDLVGRGNFQFQAKFALGDGDHYQVDVHVDQRQTYVTYTASIGEARAVGYGDMLYDITDTLYLLVHVENGQIELGLNGIEDVQTMPSLSKWTPRFAEISLGAGEEDPVLGNVYMSTFVLGLGTTWHYYDGLHKTIVPDGKDFAFSLHMHADRTYPQYLHLMANLSREYGLNGTYDAWLWANDQFYSMSESEYAQGLLDLRSAGWDLGVHGIGYVSVNRTIALYALDRMENEIGPLRTWSDHGYRQQNLYKDGTDPDSGYYIADRVEDIGAAWMHKNTKSHSFYNDLNRDGMSYTDPDYPDLPLFRVSPEQAWTMYSDPGREDDLDKYLRAWSADRSVIVTHDYLPYFFYVDNSSGPLSVVRDEEGMGYFPWSELIPKTTFVGEDWAPLPSFTRFLNWTRDYDVWFAPVRDIYDRSCLIQALEVHEDSNKVVIRNPSDQGIEGLTLYSQSQPDYELGDSGTSYTATKGSAGSWHFILDIPAGGEVVLEKGEHTGRSHPLDESPGPPSVLGRAQERLMNREGSDK